MNKIKCLWIATLCLVVSCSGEKPTATLEPMQDAETSPVARMSVDIALRSGVKLARATPGALRETLTLYGSIQPDPSRVRQIGARYPGVVRSVLQDIGDRVKVGSKLAAVESSESLQTYTVTSPLDGLITARHTNVGEVAGDMPLFEVADYSQVRVDLSVFPRDRLRLKPGQTVHIVAADSATTAEGKIAYIAPAGSATNQVIVARVALGNKDGRWSAGQFVTGEVVLGEIQASVAIVPAAIQQIKNRPVVFVQNGQQLEARIIDIGKRSSSAVEVTGGLKAGEQYVTDNSYLVKAELLKNEIEEE